MGSRGCRNAEHGIIGATWIWREDVDEDAATETRTEGQMATRGTQVRGAHEGIARSGWPAPETLLLGLIAFLAIVCTSVVGLLVGAAS